MAISPKQAHKELDPRTPNIIGATFLQAIAQPCSTDEVEDLANALLRSYTPDNYYEVIGPIFEMLFKDVNFED